MTKCGTSLYNEYGKWPFERSYINMGAVLLKILNAGGLGGAISEITSMFFSFLGGKIPEKVILVIGLVLAILVGTLGYKYIKLLSTAIFSVIGFAIGYIGFDMAKGKFGWNVPNVLAYVVGAVLLVLLGYLAYKKFAYALFTIAGVTGFLVGYFIYPNYFVGAAAAIVIALVAMSFVRYGFVALLSVSAGFTFMGLISAILPTVRLVSLTEGFVGRLVAIVISLIFAAIQLYLSRTETKKYRGPRRVKIRRVFDTW